MVMLFMIYGWKCVTNIFFSRKNIFSRDRLETFERKYTKWKCAPKARQLEIFSPKRNKSENKCLEIYPRATPPQWRTKTKSLRRKKVFQCQENVFSPHEFSCRFSIYFSQLAPIADDDESFVFGFERWRSTLSVRIPPTGSLADEVQTLFQVTSKPSRAVWVELNKIILEITRSTVLDVATTLRHQRQVSIVTHPINQFEVGRQLKTYHQTNKLIQSR